MRTHLRDHLANERTFLAWVRTSLGMLAFGFVLERFSLYLRYLMPSMSSEGAQPSHIGVGLVWLGTVMIPFALWRFFREARDIENPTMHPYPLWPIVTLGLLITAIGLYVALTLL